METVLGAGDDQIMIGGETEYRMLELLYSYELISKDFYKIRNKFLANKYDKEKYFHQREVYQHKLIKLFASDAKSILGFDKYLYELTLLDDVSLCRLLFDKFMIFESIMLPALRLFKKHNRGLFKSKQLPRSHIHMNVRQAYGIELNSILSELEQYPNITTTVSLPARNRSVTKYSWTSPSSDRYCQPCIHNRIFETCDGLFRRLMKIKPIMIEMERHTIEKAKLLAKKFSTKTN